MASPDPDIALKKRFHSGMRKILGYGPKGEPVSTLPPVIDPTEEMAARDKQRGNDISNSFPVQRQSFMRQVDDAPEVDAAPVPEETDKPYEGMNFFQAMFTPMSTAAAGRPERLASRPPSTISSLIGSITGSGGNEVQAPAPRPQPMPAGESLPAPAPSRDGYAAMQQKMMDTETSPLEYAQMAGRMALAKAQDAFDRGDERRGNAYLKAYELSNTQVARLQGLANPGLLLKEQGAQRLAEIRESNSGLAAIETARANEAMRVNKQLADLDRQAASLATGMDDDASPLREDRSLTVAEYAKARKQMAAQANLQKGTPYPAMEQSVEDSAMRTGFRVRAGQYVLDSLQSPMAPEFNADHPGMMEFKQYYQGLVDKRPADYAKIRNEVAATVGAEVFRATQAWAENAGVPLDSSEVVDYMEQVVNDIVGPEPQPGYLYGVRPPDRTQPPR